MPFWGLRNDDAALDVNYDLQPADFAAKNDFAHYMQIVALVITFYDYCINLDREVKYIWSPPSSSQSKPGWSVTVMLYIAVRYFGSAVVIGNMIVFLYEHSNELVSDIGVKVVGGGSVIVILLAQIVMQLRVKALYRQQISRIITGLWIAEVIIALCLGVSTTFSIKVTPVELYSTKLCTVTYLPRFAGVFWIPILVFEIVLFCLAFRVAVYNHVHLGSWRGANLLHVVLRDNFNFFFFAFVCYLATAVVWFKAGPRYFLVPGIISCAFTTTMGCRFILNLCQAWHYPLGHVGVTTNGEHSIWAAPVSAGIEFVTFPQNRAAAHAESRVSRVSGVTSMEAGQTDKVPIEGVA